MQEPFIDAGLVEYVSARQPPEWIAIHEISEANHALSSRLGSLEIRARRGGLVGVGGDGFHDFRTKSSSGGERFL